jgi:hypothetical protein
MNVNPTPALAGGVDLQTLTRQVIDFNIRNPVATG